MRLDGTEIEKPYTVFADIDPTEVKAGDVTGAGNPYGNKINEMHEYITQNPTEKYNVLARAMRDPELSKHERYGVLRSFCSPTEAGENLDNIFGNEQSVSVGPYTFHDPMGQIEKIPLEKMAAFEALSERGDAVVWDDILYSNNQNLWSDSIDKAYRKILDFSKTNPEAAWFWANKKVEISGYAVPMGNFLLNYRELTGEREETVRQYTERMGVEKVLDEHRDDIKREMKNYGLIDRILHRKELREQIAEKYADEAGNPIRTHEDVERLVDELNKDGYGDVVDALDFEALRQGKGKGKEIGELFGIEPVGDDDDIGVYMASSTPPTEHYGSLEYEVRPSKGNNVDVIPVNMDIKGIDKTYLMDHLRKQDPTKKYRILNRQETVKKGKSGILKKIAALGVVGLAVAGGCIGYTLLNNSNLSEETAWQLSESTSYKPYTPKDVTFLLHEQLKDTKEGYGLPVLTKNGALSDFAEERADYEVSFKKYVLNIGGGPACVARSLGFPKELVESGQFDPNNLVQLSDNARKMMDEGISMSYEIYTIESEGKKTTLAVGLDAQDILPGNTGKNLDAARKWSGDTQLQYAIYSDPRIDEIVTKKGAGCGWANIFHPGKMPHAEGMADAIMSKWMSGEARDIILGDQHDEYGLGGAQYEGNGGMVFVLEVHRKG